MDEVVHWVLGASAALLAVAVLVAWWEHWRGGAGPQGTHPGQARPRKLNIDIELDQVAERPAFNDAAQRSQALNGTLDRMTQVASVPAGGWTDTEPMIGPSLRAEPAGAQHNPSTSTSASAH